MDLDDIMKRATALPVEFEPLLLTFYSTPRSGDIGLAIGTDERTQIVVDQETGVVESIDPDGELPTRFVNSSIDHLASCIEAFATYIEVVRETDDDSRIAEACEALRECLAAVDPASTAGPDNWWSLVLEQVDDGLL